MTAARKPAARDAAEAVFLTPHELAARWKVSEITLSKWRWLGKGPDFIRLSRKGGPVVYSLAEIERHEARNTVAGDYPHPDPAAGGEAAP